MVVVKIELWPHGDESQMRPLGRIDIANDGTGTVALGNYDATFAHAGSYYGKEGHYKKGRIVAFSRNLSPYHLIARALAAAGIRCFH